MQYLIIWSGDLPDEVAWFVKELIMDGNGLSLRFFAFCLLRLF